MEIPFRCDPARCALVLVDVQNDFCYPNGSTSKAGQDVAKGNRRSLGAGDPAQLSRRKQSRCRSFVAQHGLREATRSHAGPLVKHKHGRP